MKKGDKVSVVFARESVFWFSKNTTSIECELVSIPSNQGELWEFIHKGNTFYVNPLSPDFVGVAELKEPEYNEVCIFYDMEEKNGYVSSYFYGVSTNEESKTKLNNLFSDKFNITLPINVSTSKLGENISTW